MSDLDLIKQLGDLLGRPLLEVAEERLERHFRARYGRDRSERIDRDAYSLSENGTVSGLLLLPVTSELLYDFPFGRLKNLRYLDL